MEAVGTTPQRSRRGSMEQGPWNNVDNRDGKNMDGPACMDNDETWRCSARRGSRVSLERAADYGDF
eukprot:3630834-Rhodomonas_salina.1